MGDAQEKAGKQKWTPNQKQRSFGNKDWEMEFKKDIKRDREKKREKRTVRDYKSEVTNVNPPV